MHRRYDCRNQLVNTHLLTSPAPGCSIQVDCRCAGKPQAGVSLPSTLETGEEDGPGSIDKPMTRHLIYKTVTVAYPSPFVCCQSRSGFRRQLHQLLQSYILVNLVSSLV